MSQPTQQLSHLASTQPSQRLLAELNSDQEQISTNDQFNSQSHGEHQHFFSLFSEDVLIEDNRQGSLDIMQIQNPCLSLREGHPEDFKDILDHMKTGDFSSLRSFWSPQYKKKLNFIAQNWHSFSLTYGKILPEYLKHCKDYYQKVPLNKCQSQTQFYNYFYRDYLRINRKLQRVSDFKISVNTSKNVRVETEEMMKRQKNNSIFRLVIKEQETKVNKAGTCFIGSRPNRIENSNLNNNQGNRSIEENRGPQTSEQPRSQQGAKIPIGQYIAEKETFNQNEDQWRQILFQAIVSRAYDKQLTNFQDIKQEINSVFNFSQHILDQNELTQPANRLCCSKFLYRQFNIRPVKNQNLLTRQSLFELKQQRESRRRNTRIDPQPNNPQEIEDIMVDLCALLNSGGGTLIFNCKKWYLDIQPMGERLIQSDKEKYVHVIKQAIKKIHPKVSIKKQIQLSFVPLVKNPFQQGYKSQTLEQDDKKINRDYIHGVYVLRIVATPTKRQQLYFYELGKQDIRTAVLQDSKRKELKGIQIVEQMAKRFQFQQLEGLDEVEKMLMAKDSVYTDPHQCPQPYKGYPIYGNDPVVPPTPQNNYKFVSLIVANAQYFSQIEKKLNRKGIDCWINTDFKKYNFKSSQGSAPIHHNVRFDQLLAQIAYKPQFEFNNRYTLLINVSHCLKLKDRLGQTLLPNIDFERIQVWLKKQFTNDALQYWIFTNDQNIQEHYLRTNKQLSIIYLYYVLHHHSQKSMFKNPALSQKLQGPIYRQKINGRMKRLYSNSQQSFFP